MSIWKRLWTWLTSASVKRLNKGHPDLYPIEVEKLAKELNLIDDAKRFGEAALPPQDATSISGPEATIIQRVEKIRQDYADWAVLRLNILSEDMGRHDVTKEVNRAREAAKEFARKAAAVMTEQESLLRSLGNKARMCKIELEEFKRTNSLTREARVQTTATSYLQYSFLLLLVILEGFANANFFAHGLDSGLIGGFTQALILATANVLVAFLFGKFAVRYINHINVWFKTAGVCSLILSLSMMVLIALGIGHYRDSLTSEATDSARTALQSLVAQPFDLKDFFSWMLFFVSIAFGLGALFDGLATDDYYPGYGSIARYARSAMEDYEDEIRALNDQLVELKESELNSLDKVVKESQSSVSIRQSLIEDKRMAGARLATAVRDADHSLEALLRKYRSENQLHRNGIKAPEYFNVMPSPQPIHLPDFSVESDLAILAEQKKLVDLLLADVQSIRADIQAAYNQTFDLVRPLTSHF